MEDLELEAGSHPSFLTWWALELDLACFPNSTLRWTKFWVQEKGRFRSFCFISGYARYAFDRGSSGMCDAFDI